MLIFFVVILFTLFFREKLLQAFLFLEKFELKHKIFVFIGMIFLTVVSVRIGSNIHDPNPMIFGFEIHHFDYGILMLLSLTVLLLFDRSRDRYPVYLLLSAVSLGLIIDELYFVRILDSYSEASGIQFYNQTSISVAALFMFLVIFTMIINYKKRKK
jgi:hypothetical protein